MMIGMGTACGDRIIRGLNEGSNDNKRSILNDMRTYTKILDGKRSGRLYYCVLGSLANKSADKMLEEIGFKKVGETFNEAHHDGMNMIRSYAVASTDLWDVLYPKGEVLNVDLFEELLVLKGIGTRTVEKLIKIYGIVPNFKKRVQEKGRDAVKLDMIKEGISFNRAKSILEVIVPNT